MDVLDAIDQPTEELEIEQSGDESQEPIESQESDAPQQPEEKVDGRRFNPEWSKALKELREQFPDRADMLTKLRDNYARYQALQEVAPKGLDDVRQWKSTLDAVGGAEAAAEMMQRVANIEQRDAKFEAGDPSVLDEMPEGMQKGFFQMLPDALSRLSEKDPNAFSAAVAPHFAAALAGTGMGDHLKAMYAKAEGNPELQGLIKQQFDWFNSQTQGKAGLPQGQRSVDPQVQRLQSELETRRKADDEAFVTGVTTATEKYMGDAFEKSAGVYLKQLNLTDAQKADLMDSFGRKMADKLGTDTAFNKQLQAYKALKSRNPDTVQAYIRSKVDENAKSIIDGLVTARYGGMRAKAKPAPTSTTTTDGGAVRVAQAPPQSEWDMAKMDAAGYENSAKIGRFYLKGGRTVQLAR